MSNKVEVSHLSKRNPWWLLIGLGFIGLGAMGHIFGWSTRGSTEPATGIHILLVCLGLVQLSVFGITQKSVLDGKKGYLRHQISLLGVPIFSRRIPASDITAISLARLQGSALEVGSTDHDETDLSGQIFTVSAELELKQVRIEMSSDYAGMRQRAQTLADALDVPMIDTATDRAIHS